MATVDTLEMGEPSFGASVIPIVGPSLEAEYNFKTGHPVKGTFYSAMAISDLAIVKGLAVGLAKIGIKAFRKKATTEAGELFVKEVAAESGTQIPGAIDNGEDLVTVGRWMSRTEYEAMVSTNMVQESAKLGVTNVALPETALAFMNQAEVGSLYVRFTVPAASVISKGGGWGLIPGPGSIYARLAIRQGAAAPQMPVATSIVHAATKIRN
ncbi:MAG: hypothetical protein HOP19_14830 [Acidobacteria bacterium]|nr:hypothetical protein [Acidobacteriota bacterium]